ncbi:MULTISPECIES: o-succinylbenzoate synthase [Bacillaceae]|uniref:o-succinylbenzoate synthase n=1 Tax=Bacillaceae TaxID=186817 RepID=UPI001E310F99|nr:MULTISPECIES: o-succinylbenzoate synthase [Bacillaceae]MCE4049047.1 o-succinylbenzoate synthase [Bacillus sp. Au-Bac7]UPO90514.1 o-succinylbenzoate synthase [Niallia sp. Man26]
MKIDKIVLRKVDIPLKAPFETSFAAMTAKKCIIVEIHGEGKIGYGECSAFEFPLYNEEFVNGCWAALQDCLIPLLLKEGDIAHPDETSTIFEHIRKNNLAKSSINCALWDLYAKIENKPVYQLLGGTKSQVETGVSIGIQKDAATMVKVVQGYLDEGYRRVKIKIKPGKDVEIMKAVREEFSDIMLMADANSAYTLDDIEVFKELDKLDLIMIEQPLDHDDIVDHATLQAQINTKICLDESINTVEDARKAIELGSCGIINIKVGRVGGLTEAKKIQALCESHGIPVWCGGMVDSGIARAHNIAAATLSGFTLPNDIAASSRYYNQDIINPAIELNGTYVDVPQQAGLGYDIDDYALDQFTVEKKVVVNESVAV